MADEPTRTKGKDASDAPGDRSSEAKQKPRSASTGGADGASSKGSGAQRTKANSGNSGTKGATSKRTSNQGNRGTQATPTKQARGNKSGATATATATRTSRPPQRATSQQKRRAEAAREASAAQRASVSRRQRQRESAQRLPRIRREAYSTPMARAIAIGVFLLTIFDLPHIEYSDFAAEAGVLIMLGAAGLPLLVARVIGRGTERRSTTETWAARCAAAFVVAGLVSVILAVHPQIALFGIYEHGTGWFFIVALAGCWALGTGIAERDRNMVEIAIIAGAVVNSFLALLQQLFGGWMSSIGINDYGGQPDGVLGNPVFYGALMAGALCLVAPRFLRAPRLWWPAVAFISFGLGLCGERLPTLLALIVIGVVMFFEWRKRSAGREDQEWFRSLFHGGVVIGGVVAGSILARVLGGLGVVSHTVQSTSGETFGQRVDAWRDGLRAFHAHPLFGYGPGQFLGATAKFYTPADIRNGGGIITTFPDAHNIFIEYLVTTGIIGVGLLLAWIVFGVLHRRGPMLGFALVLLGMEIAEPLNPVITPLLFFALGAATLTDRTPDEPEAAGARPGASERARDPASEPPRWVQPVGIGLAVLAAIPALLMMIGDVAFETARVDNANNQNTAAVGPAGTANALLSPWPEPASLLAAIHLALAESGGPGEFPQAIHFATVAAHRDPTDAQLWTTLARYQGSAGQDPLSRASTLTALKYQPADPDALDVLGLLDTVQHHTAAAESDFERSLSMDPNQGNYKQVLADLKRGCVAQFNSGVKSGLRFNCPR